VLLTVLLCQTGLQQAAATPIAADIDGDSNLEILYSGFDGKVHCFWADQTERFSWPFVVGTSAAMRLASVPVAADLNNDGFSEIIFATMTATAGIPAGCNAKTPCEWGKLFVLDYTGKLLSSIALPQPKSCNFSNTCTDVTGGVLASPLLLDADGNGLLDVFLLTWGAGVVRYELSNSAGFRLLYPIGKGNIHRTGQAPNSARVGPAPVQRSVISSTGNNAFPAYAIALVVVGGCVVMVAAIIGLVMYRRHQMALSRTSLYTPLAR